MATEASNKIKYLLATKVIDFANDTFGVALMQTGFTFDKDAHHHYGDISGDELATANGYTKGAYELAGVSVTEDDTDDRTEVTWNNATWNASGGSIGPSPGAIIYDKTAASDPIVGYIDFGGDQTQASGGTATISSIEFRLS